MISTRVLPSQLHRKPHVDFFETFRDNNTAQINDRRDVEAKNSLVPNFILRQGRQFAAEYKVFAFYSDCLE